MSTEIFTEMSEMEGAAGLRIPPPCFEDLNAEVVEYNSGESLVLKIPLYEKYSNPVGLILGGYLPLFFDLTMGPLSYLVTKKPATSLDLNTTFIRPVRASDEFIKVKASVVHQSRSYLLLDAQAFVGDEKLVASATSRMRIG